MLNRRTFITAGASAVAATQFAGAAWAQDPKQVTTVIAGDFRSFIPGAVPDVSTGRVHQHVFEGLLATRDDGTVAPMLAESYAMAADGLSCTFRLREGVKFHNGAPLTSAEVVWTWGQFLNPATNWAGRPVFDGSQIIKITAITADDPLTVTFTFETPSPSFPLAISRIDYDSCGIAHPDSVNDAGEWVASIGTGPYRLVRWNRSESIIVERFEDYVSRTEPADGLAGERIAHFDRITFLVVKDETAAALALQNNDVQLYPEMAETAAASVRGVSGVEVVTHPVSGTRNMLFQTKDPILQDARIRRAINHAVDCDTLAKALYGEESIAHTSFIPSTSAYFGEVQKQGFDFNPEKARALLAEAGYKGELITIQTNAQPQFNVDNALIIQAMMQAVGFNVEVQGLENAAKLANYFSGEYQLTIFHGSPLTNPIFWFEKLIGDKSVNTEKVWDNPKAIDLLAKVFATEDLAEQQTYLDELHLLWLEDAPMLTWSNRVMVSGYRSNLKGYAPWSGLKPRLWNVELV